MPINTTRAALGRSFSVSYTAGGLSVIVGRALLVSFRLLRVFIVSVLNHFHSVRIHRDVVRPCTSLYHGARGYETLATFSQLLNRPGCGFDYFRDFRRIRYETDVAGFDLLRLS